MNSRWQQHRDGTKSREAGKNANTFITGKIDEILLWQGSSVPSRRSTGQLASAKGIVASQGSTRMSKTDEIEEAPFFSPTSPNLSNGKGNALKHGRHRKLNSTSTAWTALQIKQTMTSKQDLVTSALDMTSERY